MVSQEEALINEVVQGAYIQKIVSTSPAEKAGLKKDDIITNVNDEKITGG